MTIDNIVLFSYLVQIRDSLNKVLSTLGKEIWDYLLEKGTITTAEYLQGTRNKEANFQSQRVKDASK